jgi:hypothetical protein
MNRSFGLLVGGLILFFGSPQHVLASTFYECGAASSPNNGTLGFTQSFNASVGTASVSGGVATITCSGFIIPNGRTLESVTIVFNDDAQASHSSGSEVQWTWTYTGTQALISTPSGAATETGNGFGGFNSCVTTTGNLACDSLATFGISPGAIDGNGVTRTGTFAFQVSAASIGSDPIVLAPGGGDSANVFIAFNTVPTASPSVPEPASLAMMSSGLLLVGLVARRKRL